jgi:hypothetical protein
MTGYVRALIARMLWAGLPPDRIANNTGAPLAEVRELEAELRRTIRP